MTNHLIALCDRQGRYTHINPWLIESVRFLPKEGKAVIMQSGKPAYYECKTKEAFNNLLEIINSYLSYQQPLISKMNNDDR